MGELPPQRGAPSLSNWLLHFTVRGREPLQDPVRTAQLRLGQILCDERINGRPTWWSLQRRPAVCVAECREEDLDYLVRHRGWQPWALAFQVATVAAAGGGPVWYVRTEQWQRISSETSALAAEVSDWVVRWDLNPDRFSDWRHEREWRIPGTHLDLQAVRPAALIVGDADWTPSELHDPNLGGGEQADHWVDPPLWARDLPRFLWNPDGQHIENIGPSR